MRPGKMAAIAATALVLAGGAICSMNLPSMAGPASAASPLIDKDFEIALRKFLAKKFFRRIDATEEQQEKLSKIMAETQEETRPSREELRQGLRALSELVSDSKTSDEQIKAKVKELRGLHEKVQDRRLTAFLEARKVLTDEQRQKIQKRVKELMSGAGPGARRLGMYMQNRAEIGEEI